MTTMRGGLRLQLLLLLGALLALGFLPLFFATSTYTRIALEQQQRRAALSIGRAVSAQLSHERRHLDNRRLADALTSQLAEGAIDAIGVYDRTGEAVARVGPPELVERLGDRRANVTRAEATDLATERGPAVVIFRPDPLGGVATVTRVDPTTTRALSLTRLFALYFSLGALTVLAFAYLGLTRQIVQPVLHLRRAAEKVALGGRRLETPQTHVGELADLGRSLAQMTTQLRDEEEALRRQIDEVRKKTAELEQTQASLVRSERLATVGQLSAGLAHEIGNPISALMGLVDLLLEGETSEEERADFLRRMHGEIARIDRVLRDLLAYARPQTSSSTRGSGRVETAVSDVLALLSPQKSLASIHLESEVPPDLPPVALTQEGLTQVLLNLLMNAAQVLGDRGTIRVSVKREAAAISVSVIDDGPGVPEALRERIFEPFVTTKPVGKGTGLGLSVSRGLAEAVGGSLELVPSAGSGAHFELRIPTV